MSSSDVSDVESTSDSEGSYSKSKKRHKETYIGGRILSITISNFMTYDYTVLKPSPGLNLIIGPNGSGKSTTVCAICLGLAGKPYFAGRHMQLKDFVKHGKKKAFVEIELDDVSKKKNLVIKRVIKSDGSSKYFINGKLSKESEVLQEVKRFNIQTNNLCQFLPQERVSEFSKMNPVQLLESMQQAVGNASLFKHHDELKKLRERARKLENSISNVTDSVTSQRNQNKQSESDVRRFEEIAELKKKRKLLEELLPLIQYKESLTELRTIQRQKKEAEHELKKLETKLKPLQQNLKKIDLEMNQCNKKVHDGKMNFKTQMLNIKKCSDKTNNLQNQIESADTQLNVNIEDQKKIKERIKAIEIQINDIEKELENREQTKIEMEHQAMQLRDDIEKAEQEVASFDYQLDSTKVAVANCFAQKESVKRELQKINDIENQKLNFLKQRDMETFNAVMWLKDHRHLFKKNIYNPLFMEIKVLDPNNIKFIESLIAFRDLTAFMCEDREDSKLLVDKLRGERGWAISAVVPPPHELSDYVPKVSVQHMREKYHLKDYVKDLFTAPDAILRFLCANYNIHNTPVGDETTEQYIGLIKNGQQFTKFFTCDSFHTVKRSRYGQKLITMNSMPLKPPQFLRSFTDTTDLQRQLEESIKTIDLNINELKQQEEKLGIERQRMNLILEGLRKKKKDYLDLKATVRNLECQVKHKRNTLDSVKKEVKSIPILIKEMEQTVNDLKQRALKEIMDGEKLCKTATKIYNINLKSMVLEYLLAERHHELSVNLEEDQKSCVDLKNEIKEKSRTYNTLKDKTMELYAVAGKAVNMQINESAQSALEKKYAHLPHNVENIQSEMHGIDARLNLFGETNEKAYMDHKTREVNIVESEQRLVTLQGDLNTLKNNIRLKKDLWLKPLNSLIEQINDTFRRYMQSLNCAGEVGLKVAENPDDFDKYGLSILVKFRDKNNLQELSHARHSGGECSVATIIFILALQKLTDVPFRCVDEINQGMDAINERRIFELVSLSSGNSSQYFLLTPKLLSGLKYPKTISLHVIQNAPGLQADMNWNMRHLCKIDG